VKSGAKKSPGFWIVTGVARWQGRATGTETDCVRAEESLQHLRRRASLNTVPGVVIGDLIGPGKTCPPQGERKKEREHSENWLFHMTSFLSGERSPLC
jgi:hypothetical protein